VFQTTRDALDKQMERRTDALAPVRPLNDVMDSSRAAMMMPGGQIRPKSSGSSA
jgi:hypothetical protein